MANKNRKRAEATAARKAHHLRERERDRRDRSYDTHPEVAEFLAQNPTSILGPHVETSRTDTLRKSFLQHDAKPAPPVRINSAASKIAPGTVSMSVQSIEATHPVPPVTHIKLAATKDSNVRVVAPPTGYASAAEDDTTDMASFSDAVRAFSPDRSSTVSSPEETPAATLVADSPGRVSTVSSQDSTPERASISSLTEKPAATLAGDSPERVSTVSSQDSTSERASISSPKEKPAATLAGDSPGRVSIVSSQDSTPERASISSPEEKPTATCRAASPERPSNKRSLSFADDVRASSPERPSNKNDPMIRSVSMNADLLLTPSADEVKGKSDAAVGHRKEKANPVLQTVYTAAVKHPKIAKTSAACVVASWLPVLLLTAPITVPCGVSAAFTYNYLLPKVIKSPIQAVAGRFKEEFALCAASATV
ncbi:hypothetical protein HKX48_001994 [Thoreauomyces humboldtii]|nr:hypothetical protein HKX48_001994 [Thoreauomyces humboldtii]